MASRLYNLMNFPAMYFSLDVDTSLAISVVIRCTHRSIKLKNKRISSAYAKYF
jgi:hypothetical protein